METLAKRTTPRPLTLRAKKRLALGLLPTDYEQSHEDFLDEEADILISELTSVDSEEELTDEDVWESVNSPEELIPIY